MKEINIILILLIGMLNKALTQDATAFQHEIQANYLMESDVNGSRYGLQVEYNRSIFRSDNHLYQLSLGGVNEFFVKDERDIPGITGNTISNLLGATVSNSLYFLKTKKLSVTNTLYAGWGHRRTKANYTNEQFDINRDHESSFNYFAFGAYWKLGYRIKDKMSIQAIGKTDFSRLMDRYEPTIFERPGFMYGLGVVYFIK
jgi:hypothetical protein